MKIKNYFSTVLKSLNPNAHRELVKLEFATLIKYFLFLVLASSISSVVLLFPMLAQYKNDLGGELQMFDQFSLDIDAELDEQITVLDTPEIVVDFSKNNATDEFILINKESLFYKKFIFFGKESIRFSDYQSVKNEKSAELYTKIMILLLPAILFWIVVLNLIKYAILIALFSISGWIFFISSRNQVTLSQTAKTAIFTATPMVILDLALWPVKFMLVLPVLIYFVYFIIGLVMVSERKYFHNKGRGGRNDPDFLAKIERTIRDHRRK